MVDLLALIHRDMTAAYKHVRDDHSLPIWGTWTAESLVEVHARLHEIEVSRGALGHSDVLESGAAQDPI